MKTQNEKSLTHYLDLLDAEIKMLRSLIPDAVDLQWDAPPKSGGRVKSKSDIADPTGNLATDPARLQLRYQLSCSDELLKNALINARGVRRGLEHRLAPYLGEE